MNNDPIVEEVRRTRDKLARKFNYDIRAIFTDLRARQDQENPAHPLVHDASEWKEETVLLLNDKTLPKP